VRFVLISFLLFTSTSFAADLDRDMKETVGAFYNIYISVRSSGIPSEKEQLKFKPYISASLENLLQEAAVAERKYYKTTKGEVPPLVEGDLFTSLFEGASNFTVLSCDVRTRSCLVEFNYFEPGNKSSTTWKDKVYLIQGPRGLLVDDIEYLGNWQFMHKGRLKELLKQVIEEGN